MSRMLNLVDELLSRSRRLQQFGRHDEAFNVLTRLATFPDLPARARQEAEARLGELCLRERKYKRARRHLRAALRHQPKNARYHYLLAHAFARGSAADMSRALDHYRLSLELKPGRPARLCAVGLLLVRLGLSARGLQYLRQAIQFAPEDVAILRKVVKGMQLANRAAEARQLLFGARFRRPHDRELTALCHNLQFDQLRKDQQISRQRVANVNRNALVLLPFVRAEGEAMPTRRARIVRQDGPSGTPPPRGLLRVRRPDQRHAQ
jgi:tetratricopeptide (TPR) repeat protein